MAKSTTELKLKERIKELKCLYELSRIALQSKNDFKSVATKTLSILPAALQYPRLAEAKITLSKSQFKTSKFGHAKHTLSEPIKVDGKQKGSVAVGYRGHATVNVKQPFLKEERSLLRAIARELSLVAKRTIIEEERKSLQVQLQHVERLALIGELTAGIAHELNEPLGRILGFSQLIKKGGMLKPQQEEDLERIIKASLYTREIIKKLMFFSRQMPQQITTVSLNEVISNILYFIDARYQGNKILIDQKLQEPLPAIQADAVQMSQVLVNLITNSIHAMPNGGNLLIQTSSKPDYVSLVVKDNGQGMPPAVKKKIFEPFYTTKPVGQGTGLGLSVVQGIVSAHHGKVHVQSRPGKGSKFEILLPIKHNKKPKQK
ncbi:MAG: ATP-binding protein [Cyclobacteriaceae bacterium]|nr:sensor histidine kinase [Flammeovirgaceae bacterium]MCO5271330.1 ATP-binding protein [Cyclobacteriaceae bacterium]